MLWLLLLFLYCGYIPNVVSGSCAESNGNGGSKTLASPCTFTQLAGRKNWESSKLQESTDVFFRFEMMNCENYKESNGKITLTCFHSDSFYIMKRVLSFGATTKVKFEFEFNPSNELTYNDTKIIISGHLSKVLYSIEIQATKEAGNSDFEFSTETIAQMDMVAFITQRMTAAGRQLGEDFNNAIKVAAINCVMTGIFSALNGDPNKPNGQSFELLITHGNGKEFYIIQNTVAEERYVIAYYKDNSDSRDIAPRLYMKNVLNIPFLIPQGFSPVFDAAASAYGISEDLIVNINNGKLRDLAQKYVSQSSQGLLLKGGNLYWHIADPNEIKILAKNVPNVEDPPTPSSETSSSGRKLKADKKTKSKRLNKEDLIKETSIDKNGAKGKDAKNVEKQKSTNFMSLNDYVNEAKHLVKMTSKRSGDADFTERDSKIALNANFDKYNVEEIIEISSPEYLKGQLKKVLQTFMPNYDVPSAASQLSELQVVFDRIVLYIPRRQGKTKKMSIHCNITQNYDLVKNFISGDGITIIAETDLSKKVPQGRQEWIIKGKGRTEVLQQLINVELGVDKKGQLLVRGVFEIANMTEFFNATGEVNYLPQAYREAYPHLVNFALTKLNLKSIVGSPKLRIIGKCLLFSQPKTDALVAVERREGIEDDSLSELILPSKIRIIMKNETSVQYVVGIIGEDIPFEEAIMHLFKKSVSGASWVKFRKLGIVMSNIDGLQNEFQDSFLKNIVIKAGIQGKASLLLPKEEDCKIIQAVEGNAPKIMTDATCMFLKDRPALVGFFGPAVGTIDTVGYKFESNAIHKKWFKLSPESTNPIEIKKPTFYLGPETGTSSTDALFRIDASFKVLFNGNLVIYKGYIEFDELKGKLILRLTRFKEYDSNNIALPFSFNQMRNGYSVMRSDGEFTRFVTASQISIGFTDDNMVLFPRHPAMIFDVMDSKKLYIRGFAKNFERAKPGKRRNILLEIFKVFGSNLHQHIIFKRFQSEQLTGVIYSAADEDFKVPYFNEFTFKKGLNVYGTVRLLLIARRKFHFHYDADTATVTMEVSLPPVKIPMGSPKPLLVLGRNKKYSNRGGRLEVIENKQRSEVKFIGYMKTVGVEMPIEFAVKPNGKFKIDLNQAQNQNGEIFKLFNQAPCKMTLEQASPARFFRLIDPVLTIDFAPATVALEKATKDFVKRILANIKAYRSSKFNRFMRIVGTSGATLRDLAFNLNQQLKDSVEQIESVKNKLNADCVKKCETKRLSVFGYKMKKGKPVGDESFHEVANVLCIAECEMVKPLSVSTQEALLDRIEKMQMSFEEIMQRSELMQKLLDLHFNHLSNIGHQLKRATIRASINLDKIDMKIKKNNPVPFGLTLLRYEKPLSEVQLKGNGSKCIVGIQSAFNYLGQNEKRLLNLCFNGEYEKYTAKEIIHNYYKEINFRRFDKNMDQAAEARNELETITDDVIGLFEKVADPSFEYTKLLDLIESTALELPSDEEPIKKKRKGNGKKKRRRRKNKKQVEMVTPYRAYITYGDQNISLPAINTGAARVLKVDNPYSFKSPKSKRAFIYSSPWAALNNIEVHKNDVFSSYSAPSLNGKGNYCKRLSEVSEVFDKIRRSLSNYAMSYVSAKKELGDTNTILQNGLEELKATVNFSVNYKMNKGQHKGVMFWYNQYKRGVSMYDKLMNGKLKEHNDNGLKRWKMEVEASLKKSGVASLDDFLATFQNEVKSPEARSMVPNKDNWLAERVSNVCKDMKSLLKDPSARLEQANTAVDSISKNFEAIKPKISSCHST